MRKVNLAARIGDEYDRYLISTVLGGIVTLALAYLMQVLIFTDELLQDESEPPPVFSFLIPPETPEAPSVTGIPPRPEPLPPRPAIDKDLPDEGGVVIPITIDPIDRIGPIEPGQLVRVLTPLVRVPPEYPYRELSRGREGYVIVGFDVNAEGLTQNLRVLESQPSHAFDNAALQSVAAWRYRPQTDNQGNPITVGGQRVRIDFVLPEEQRAAQ